jgi:PBP1b-binding outer membrane lipoprotein LpoB
MKALLFSSLAFTIVIFAGCNEPKQTLKKPQAKYPALNAKILQTIPDNELDSAIVDHVFSKIGGDYEHEYQTVTSMSKGFQMAYSTWWVEAEVHNGGFNQYFWNSSGKFRNEAVEGFKLIGAIEHEKLLVEAIELQKQQESKLEQQKAKGTIEAFSESYKDNPLNKLDERFYKLTEKAGNMRIQFIRSHPELFVSDLAQKPQ